MTVLMTLFMPMVMIKRFIALLPILEEPLQIWKRDPKETHFLLKKKKETPNKFFYLSYHF